MVDQDQDQPVLRKGGDHADSIAQKIVEKTGDLQEKVFKHDKKEEDDKTPAGGYDDTPIPSAPAGYTLRITFHRAEHLPIADLGVMSSDPYIHATMKTSLPQRHKSDPDLVLRTPTIHRNVNPKWETQWIIAHVPASGFFLKCRLYDEDPADYDDRLGNIHVKVDHIDDQWKGFKEKSYDLKKRMGSKRAYGIRGVAALFSKSVKMSGNVIVSVENLGRSPGDSGGRMYTVAPLPWSRHHSPLIGRIAGTKDREEDKSGNKSVERYNFSATQMQLRGPVPAELYHRYVEFRPFVAGMFTDVSLRGKVLNRALHHQHARIYNFDRTTIYGIFEKPCPEMTKQLLEFLHYDEGGRIFTYVLTLDGQWRFTETGKEFGIDLLSKHTMHSDVSIYIAFSGEFFIRRLKHPHGENEHSSNSTSDVLPPSAEEEPPKRSSSAADTALHHTHPNAIKDPAHYELIIDNDSGTYRPNADLLHVLRDYLSQNFPGLKVATLDCQKDAERMGKLKDEQRQRKKDSGKNVMYMQNNSSSSLSGSDVEKLDDRAGGIPSDNKQAQKKKAPKLKGRSGHDSSSSSISDIDQAANNMHLDDKSKGSGGSKTTDELSHEKTYANDQLPDLIEGNGQQQAQPHGESHEENQGEAEKGDNKPAGGIAYNTVVNTS